MQHAADEGSMSRRSGGIHFRQADLAGRQMPRISRGENMVSKAQSYFDGTAKPTTGSDTPMLPLRADCTRNAIEQRLTYE